MEQNHNPWFVVQCTLPAGYRPGPGPSGNAPVVKEAWYGLRMGQPGLKVMWDAPPRVGPPKAIFGSGDAGYKPSGTASWCYNCGRMGHYLKDCKVPRAQVQAAHMAAVGSNAKSDAEEGQEKLVKGKEAPQEVEEQLFADYAESIQIDEAKYITVDVYDNNYYACDDKKEYLFALLSIRERVTFACDI
ncbi:hypothetical protein C0992_007895 [Termitomyces sp. T32_za158]|nr:hypothetical protein C0992_007895 [Termitomyces sp. T32_za158]